MATTQGAFGVAQRGRHPLGAACGQPPLQREGGSVWQIFTLEQLNSRPWNIAKVHRPPSVGRSLIGTGLQDNAPAVLVTSYRPASTPPRPPKSSYASKGICPIYRYTNNLNYSYGCYLCWNTPVDSLQSRLGELASLIPSTLSNRLKIMSEWFLRYRTKTQAPQKAHKRIICKTNYFLWFLGVFYTPPESRHQCGLHDIS